MAQNRATIKIVNSRAAARVIAQLKNYSQESQAYEKALMRIGTVIRNTAIEEITQQGAVDTGHLRSRITFIIDRSKTMARVSIGPFGVKYARMVEFGGPFTDRMRRAMFLSFRERGKTPKPGKGVISGGYVKPRPFLGPAFQKEKPEVIKILRDLVHKASDV